MDFVSTLNLFCQRNQQYGVSYANISEELVDGVHIFVVECTLKSDKEEFKALGKGSTKIMAKQNSAELMFETKQELIVNMPEKISYRIIFGNELDPNFNKNALEEIWNGCDTFSMAIRKKMGNEREVRKYVFKLADSVDPSA